MISKRRRAVSEVISTLLLVAISVVGASILAVFVSDFLGAESLGTQDSPAKLMQIRSFDSRDNVDLMGYDKVNNEPNQLLCGISCDANADNIPENGGTEFFVIQVENRGSQPVFVDRIYVNNILYRWDVQTEGIELDAEADDAGGNYPLSGKFSIYSTNDFTQTSNEIQSGKTVNILFKINSESDDISLNKGMIVRINVGGLGSQEFIIESGGAQ